MGGPCRWEERLVHRESQQNTTDQIAGGVDSQIPIYSYPGLDTLPSAPQLGQLLKELDQVGAESPSSAFCGESGTPHCDPNTPEIVTIASGVGEADM
jgi:hypothetical protein